MSEKPAGSHNPLIRNLNTWRAHLMGPEKPLHHVNQVPDPSGLKEGNRYRLVIDGGGIVPDYEETIQVIAMGYRLDHVGPYIDRDGTEVPGLIEDPHFFVAARTLRFVDGEPTALCSELFAKYALEPYRDEEGDQPYWDLAGYLTSVEA